MARTCTGCAKWCSVELEEQVDVEYTEEDVRHDGIEVNVTGMLVLNSGCCGAEVATTDAEGGVDIDIAHVDKCKVGEGEGDVGYEVELGEPTEASRSEGGGRYMKTFYAVEVEVTVTCEECKASGSGTARLEQQASYFENSF